MFMDLRPILFLITFIKVNQIKSSSSNGKLDIYEIREINDQIILRKVDLGPQLDLFKIVETDDQTELQRAKRVRQFLRKLFREQDRLLKRDALDVSREKFNTLNNYYKTYKRKSRFKDVFKKLRLSEPKNERRFADIKKARLIADVKVEHLLKEDSPESLSSSSESGERLPASLTFSHLDDTNKPCRCPENETKFPCDHVPHHSVGYYWSVVTHRGHKDHNGASQENSTNITETDNTIEPKQQKWRVPGSKLNQAKKIVKATTTVDDDDDDDITTTETTTHRVTKEAMPSNLMDNLLGIHQG